MKAYLIDFENVNSKGLNGIDSLGGDDSVYIFYSDKSDTLSFEMHQKVMESTAKIVYVKVNVGGKNALDFQLSTYLGYLVAKEKYSHIFVISSDKGFDFLHDFWNVKKYENVSTVVHRTKTIGAAVNFAERTSEEVSEEDNKEVQIHDFVKFLDDRSENTTEENAAEETPSVKADMSKSYFENITELLKGVKEEKNDIELAAKLFAQSADKRDFHNNLMKNFNNADASPIYQRFKNNFDDLKKIINQEAAAQSVKDDKGAENKSEKKIKNSEKKSKSTKNKKPVSKTNTARSRAKTKKNTETVENNDVRSVDSSKLTELLSDICSEEETAFVNEQFNEAATKQQLYIRMIKAFKREKGCKIYGAIRSEYENAHSKGN